WQALPFTKSDRISPFITQAAVYNEFPIPSIAIQTPHLSPLVIVKLEQPLPVILGVQIPQLFENTSLVLGIMMIQLFAMGLNSRWARVLVSALLDGFAASAFRAMGICPFCHKV